MDVLSGSLMGLDNPYTAFADFGLNCCRRIYGNQSWNESCTLSKRGIIPHPLEVCIFPLVNPLHWILQYSCPNCANQCPSSAGQFCVGRKFLTKIPVSDCRKNIRSGPLPCTMLGCWHSSSVGALHKLMSFHLHSFSGCLSCTEWEWTWLAEPRVVNYTTGHKTMKLSDYFEQNLQFMWSFSILVNLEMALEETFENWNDWVMLMLMLNLVCFSDHLTRAAVWYARVANILNFISYLVSCFH